MILAEPVYEYSEVGREYDKLQKMLCRFISPVKSELQPELNVKIKFKRYKTLKFLLENFNTKS